MSNNVTVAVLGGGIAGIEAAMILADSGFIVYLIEKDKKLGGSALKWSCMATDKCHFCGACLVSEAVDKVLNYDNINLCLGSVISNVQKREKTGYKIILNNGSDETVVSADSVLLTTGIRPYDPSGIVTLGYNRLPGIMTTVDLNRIIRDRKFDDFLSQGIKTPRIAFIQCVGSRNKKDGCDYCSQVCCKISIRLVQKIKSMFPDSRITIFYIDLQITGKGFRAFAMEALKDVRLLQGVPAEIRKTGQNELQVIHEDEAGARKAFDFDRIVLSVGMVPSDDLIEIAPAFDVKPDKWGFLCGKDSFLPDNVFAAGCALGPVDILTAREQARNTAISIVESFSKDSVQKNYNKKIAIIGGGRAGQSVAFAAVEAGYLVVLIDSGNVNIDKHGIESFDCAEPVGLHGAFPDFVLNVKTREGMKMIDVNSVVIATGYNKAFLLPQYLENIKDNVISLGELSSHIKGAGEDIPRRVMFFIDRAGHEWKGNSRIALKASMELVERGIDVSYVMDNMLVHGLEGQELYDSARRAGVKFLRFNKSSLPLVGKNKEGIIFEIEETTVPGMRIKIKADLLVLPELVHPADSNSLLGRIFSQPLDQEDFLQPSNIRHRLVSSPVRGVFFAGGCHDEVDLDDLAFETKSVITALKTAFIFKTGAGLYGEIDEKKCARCLTCLRVCPHMAVMLIDGVQPRIKSEACFGCGICVASCPALAINLNNEKYEAINNAHDEIVVFACERSGALALKEVLKFDKDLNNIRVVAVSCAGRIDENIILDALLKGAKKVLVTGCHDGNCRSMKGSLHAKESVKRAASRLGLDPSLISFHNVSANETEILYEIIASLN